MTYQLIAVIEREGSGYVSLCPELDIASQGDSIEQARENLQEAVELFFECASPGEISQCFRGEVYVTRLEVNELRIGTLRSIIRQSGLPRSEFEA